MKTKLAMVVFCQFVKVAVGRHSSSYYGLSSSSRITTAFTTSSSLHALKVETAISSSSSSQQQRFIAGGGRRTIINSCHHAKGQMTMWGEDNNNAGGPKINNDYDNQRRIPITTPQRSRQISTDSEGRNMRGGRGGDRDENAPASTGGGGWDDNDDDGYNSNNSNYKKNNNSNYRKNNNNSNYKNNNNSNYKDNNKDKSWDDFDDNSFSSSGSNGNSYNSDNNRSNKRNFNSNNNNNNNNNNNRGNYNRQDTRNNNNSNNNNNNSRRRGGGQEQTSRFSDNRRGGDGGNPKQWKREDNYNDNNSFRGRDNNNNNNRNRDVDPSSKINLRALEGAGFDHLYGLAPILNALASKRRDFNYSPDDKNANMDDDNGNWETSSEDDDREKNIRYDIVKKPEATFKPYLFVQESQGYSTGKVGNKALAADQLENLAAEIGITVAKVDKGVLNTLCQNRPHQGYVLRCGGLDLESLSRIPYPSSLEDNNEKSPSLWLVLDEIMDPQNFGALLRSAYFLGGGGSTTDGTKQNKIGIMVCSKNSAPPSPVVSAASAGALELCQVYSTSNLPRTLNAAKSDGWRVLGAATSVPSGMNNNDDDEPVVCQDLLEVDAASKDQPTILVLGSEGHGLRTLVAKACTGFIKIPGASDTSGDDDDDNSFDERKQINSCVGVDSLNVSVTGGIMLWNLLNGKK